MEGLYVDSIPRVLLARILVQLYIIPQKLVNNPQFNLIPILLDGLQEYGNTSDLNGLFEFCLEKAINMTGNKTNVNCWWWWKDLALYQTSDWNRLDLSYSKNKSEPINLHIQIMTEEARKGVIDIKYGHEAVMTDDKNIFYQHNVCNNSSCYVTYVEIKADEYVVFCCCCQGSPVRIDSILDATMNYLNEKHVSKKAESSSSVATPVSSSMQVLEQLVQSRICRFKHDKEIISKQQENTLQASSNYILMGALMNRYDPQEPQWEFYLRDFISNDDGKLWRVLSDHNAERNEIKITSDQALADIRGDNHFDEHGKLIQPRAHSRAFRPVYLFYCNRNMVVETMKLSQEEVGQTSQQQEGGNSMTESGITLADYILDEEDRGYVYDNPEDDKVCKVCGIDEIVEDVNNMFYCDQCDLGVHQLCENPPVQQFETEVDPWYCRECSRRKGIPLPQQLINEQSSILPYKRPAEQDNNKTEETKRRRDELGEGPY
ncbi:hypothetical protein INT45_001036 [Circinella minor]|uniref:PHD-type domain-containing protein n=1 Tax=Circinella minor TaxID=1195481 RepID=A0A8H7VTN7_9FUNG|nr:hypothetical protein INT45_001036 [Circinella minor]